jgi:tetratricopeptide (TPR) repeat protein
MSNKHDTFKGRGEEHFPFEAASAVRKAGVEAKAGPGVVAGSRNQRTLMILLLSMVFSGVGVIGNAWLLKVESTFLPARPTAAGLSATMATLLSAASAVAHAADEAVPPKQSVAAEPQPQGVIPPPPWYEAGWNAASTGEWSNAFLAWEGGVRGLPKDRMVIAGNSYARLNAFAVALRKYVRMFPSIGVRQHYNGKIVYRLIVFPYGGGIRRVFPKVKSVFPHAGLVNASFVQARMVKTQAAGPALAKVAKAGGGTKPQAGKADTAPIREPAAAANPAAVEKALLFTTSRMAVDNADTHGSGATQPAGSEQAATWGYQSRAVREQLKAEAYAEAARNARLLARDFPDRWEAWFWLGTALLARGQTIEADAALEQAGKLNPKVAAVWVQRAVVAQERGDHAAALRLLAEARELSPKSPQIYLNLGYSNDALGLPAEAKRNYRYFMLLTDGDIAYLLQRTLVIERLERNQ